jgi:hypothetical protein
MNKNFFISLNISYAYQGYILSYEGGKDIIKVLKFIQVIGDINNVLKPSFVQRYTRLNIYETLAKNVLAYGSEA